MKIALLIVSILCLFFAVTTFTLWQHERQQNLEIDRLKSQAESQDADRQKAEIVAQATIGNQKLETSVCGVYTTESSVNPSRKMDLRSDATVIYYLWTASGWFREQKSGFWALTDDGKVHTGRGDFKTEGDDLLTFA
jgi:hypothetical protein